MAQTEPKPKMPSVPGFKELTAAQQALVYRAAYHAMQDWYEKGLTVLAKKREKLLQEYQKVAGWSDEEALDLCLS